MVYLLCGSWPWLQQFGSEMAIFMLNIWGSAFNNLHYVIYHLY